MIESIYEIGDDALDNEFEIFIPSFPGVVDLDNTTLRITELNIPDIGINTYTVDYKTQQMTKPKGKIKTANSFDFTFRIDKYWKVYEGFEEWLASIIDPETGSMGLDGLPGVPSTIRVPIDVIPIMADGTETKKGWQFVGSYITDLQGVGFKQAGGDPLLAKVTIDFIKRVLRT